MAMQILEQATPRGEAAVFSRLLENGTGGLSPDLARYILGLGFSRADQTRMGELAAKNQAGTTSPEEKEELLGFVKAGHLLAVLQSRARKALRKRVS